MGLRRSVLCGELLHLVVHQLFVANAAIHFEADDLAALQATLHLPAGRVPRSPPLVDPVRTLFM